MVFRRPFLVVMIFLLGLMAVVASFQLDQPLQQLVRSANQGHWSHDPAASAASKYGDWPELMLLGGLAFLWARQCRNFRWKRILLSAMIASTLAGMTVNLSRLTTGRTRPRAVAEQGWYGPYHDGKWLIGQADFNSFPSGHTATAVGFAGVILFAAPAWGIPAMVVAFAVALSRVLLGAHHPSDVVTAAVVSLGIAWAVWEFLGKPGHATTASRKLRPWFSCWRFFLPPVVRKVNLSAPTRVIIYGDFPDWWLVLWNWAPVWRFLGGVREVVVAPTFKDLPSVEPSLQKGNTVIIPLMEKEIQNCPRNWPMLVPDRYALDFLSDKAAFADYVKREKLSHLCPVTYSGIEEAMYPCVLKRVNQRAGDGVEVVESRDQLITLLETSSWRGEKFLLQSLVAGSSEYVTHLICRDGVILWHSSFEYQMTGDSFIRGSKSRYVMRPFSPLPKHLEQLNAFLAPLSYTGPCNIDYKISSEENVVVFEINPRFGGSLMIPENIVPLRDALACLIEAALQSHRESVN